jgi:hypothetical protein
MVPNYIKVFQSKALLNIPKTGICYENIPSGNPDPVIAVSKRMQLSFSVPPLSQTIARVGIL